MAGGSGNISPTGKTLYPRSGEGLPRTVKSPPTRAWNHIHNYIRTVDYLSPLCRAGYGEGGWDVRHEELDTTAASGAGSVARLPPSLRLLIQRFVSLILGPEGSHISGHINICIDSPRPADKGWLKAKHQRSTLRHEMRHRGLSGPAFISA